MSMATLFWKGESQDQASRSTSQEDMANAVRVDRSDGLDGMTIERERDSMMRLPLLIAIVVAIIGGRSLAGECSPRPAEGGLDFSLPCIAHSPIPETDSRVYFASGSFELSDEAKAILDRQVAILRRFPTWKIKLIGFADTKEAPSTPEMERLGLKRAAAAREYLTESGLAAGRITAVGRPYAPFIPRRIDDETLASMRHVRTDAVDR